MNQIDWKPFDKYPEDTCECRCGFVYRSHAKFVMTLPGLVARKPCPSCGKTELASSRSDPELGTIK